MRRIAKSALLALGLGVPLVASAADITPTLEYAVRRKNESSLFFSDLKSAGQSAMAIRCEEAGYIECEFYKVSAYDDGGYVTLFFYKRTPDDPSYTGTAYNYIYYSCANPPALFLIDGPHVRGPFENRTQSPHPLFGKGVCRYEFDPETDSEHQSELGAGDCTTRPNVGNPINVGLNNKYQEVVDILATAGSPLSWSRYYNSGIVGDGKVTLPATAHLGARWRGTYDRSLVAVEGRAGTVRLLRHTGERLEFTEADGSYRSVADPRGQLTRTGDGWTYRSAAGETEAYDATGRLVSLDAGTAREVRLVHGEALTEVVDAQGRRLVIGYDSTGRIATVSDDTGIAVTYAYDETAEAGLKADLIRATYADNTFHAYHYNEAGFVSGEPRPHALTGIDDETGVRFATFRYDSEGRAVASEHIGGVDAVHLARQSDGSVAVTGPLKSTHRYRYAEVRGVKRLVGVDQPGGAGCAAASAAIEYDDNGMVSKRTGFDGRVTTFKHDANGNETERTEAAGTASARTITTEWHADLRQPIRITMPGREERYAYDDSGNVTRREVWAALDPTQPDAPLTLSRVWRMTYDAQGRLTHEEGPRSDSDAIGTLATYTYRTANAPHCAGGGACDYRKGDLWKVTDAIGHADEILTYDKAGRVLSRRDVHGTVITTTYTPRGWLASTDEARPDGTHALTTLTHNDRGDITAITDPDGVTLSFEYDEAGRLIQIANPSKHRLYFTLDAAGNRTTEASYDSLFLATQLKRTFDALGRVETETRDKGAVTRYTYDELGRPTGVTDADGRQDTSGYDALGRLRQTIEDAGGLKAITTTGFDPLDQLTSVEDAKGVTTRYLATGLGDIGSVDSPDGGTSIDEHDAAGLLRTHDGPGGVGSFTVTRDALGRPVTVTYADRALDTGYRYDTADTTCAANERYATGRLSSVTQGSTRTAYCYDAAGQITRKTQQVDGTTQAVSYRYSLAGRLTEVAVDGGARTVYGYDRDGSVTAITATPATGAPVNVITKVAYRPFDLFQSWTYGNGRSLSVNRDGNGWITSWGGIEKESSTYALFRSPAGQIDAHVARYYAFGFDYDGLGHVRHVADYDNGAMLREFGYDPTGDRTSMTVGAQKQSYLYDPSSHRLTMADGKARRYDAAGNTIGIGDATLDFDAAGRLASASEQSKTIVTYAYDALGQRIARTDIAAKSTTRILYDENGRWLADADEAGRVTRQAIWLGDYLVGLVDGGKVMYIEPDHLGGPRAVVDPATSVALWRWRPSDDPFGTAAPDEDPDGDGTRFVFDLRFPGQRYDDLTGLHYNYFRDNDPATGRYVEVDPIGLAGGVNPYLYANGAPLRYSDPLGLYAWNDPLPNWLVDGVAGLGDTLSFGGTRVARRWMGTSDAVDTCSRAYKNGEWGGVGMSAVFGGAHLGRNALYQMGRAGGLGTRISRGVGRVFSDNRKWGTVRDSWSLAAGSGQRWLAANGQSLHHWLIPQRVAEVHAGFNYMSISAGLNSWMNGSTFSRLAVERGFRGVVTGIYGAPLTRSITGGDCTCER